MLLTQLTEYSKIAPWEHSYYKWQCYRLS